MAEESTATTAAADPKNKTKKKASKKKKAAKKKSASAAKFGPLGFPKHSIPKALRIPQAVLENNAGKDCTDREAAGFAGSGWSGGMAVEISSALKYGLLGRPSPGRVEPTDLTRRIVRPQKPTDKIDAMRASS